jgi:hypothetical protein
MGGDEWFEASGARLIDSVSAVPMFEEPPSDPVDDVRGRLESVLTPEGQAALSGWFDIGQPQRLLTLVHEAIHVFVATELDSASTERDGVGRLASESPRLRGAFPGIDPGTALRLGGAAVRVIEVACLASAASRVLVSEGAWPTLRHRTTAALIGRAVPDITSAPELLGGESGTRLVGVGTGPDLDAFVDIGRRAGLLGGLRKTKKGETLGDIGVFYAWMGTALFHAALATDQEIVEIHGGGECAGFDLDDEEFDEPHLERVDGAPPTVPPHGHEHGGATAIYTPPPVLPPTFYDAWTAEAGLADAVDERAWDLFERLVGACHERFAEHPLRMGEDLMLIGTPNDFFVVESYLVDQFSVYIPFVRPVDSTRKGLLIANDDSISGAGVAIREFHVFKNQYVVLNRTKFPPGTVDTLDIGYWLEDAVDAAAWFRDELLGLRS